MERLNRFFGRKENVYVVFALVFGTGMMLLVPPFQVPDEAAHHQRAWEIASGRLVCPDSGKTFIPMSARSFPKQMEEVSETDGKAVLPNRESYLALLGDESDFRPVTVGNTHFCGSNPIGYLPAAFGLDVGRFFSVPAVVSFYLGRLSMLLVCVFLTYLAIRTAPFGKNIFLLVGLFPMTLHQYASLSYDATSIALGLLFTAYMLRLSSVARIPSRGEWLVAFGLSAALLSAKPGYYAFAALSLLIYPAYAGRVRDFLRDAGLFIAGNIAVAVANFSTFRSPEDIWPYRVMTDAQLSFVSRHPSYFLGAVSETLDERLISFLTNMIGKLGPLIVDMPDTAMVLAVVLVFFVLGGAHNERVPLVAWQRLVLGGIFLVNSLFVFLIIYGIWTRVGNDEIVGVQGRYFLSSFPLLLLAFYGLRPAERFRNMILYVGMVLVSLAGVWSVYRYYYPGAGAPTFERPFVSVSGEDIRYAEAKTFRQTITPSRADLSRFHFRTDPEADVPKVYVVLKDERCEEALRREEADIEKEPGAYSVDFGVVPESDERAYCVELFTKSDDKTIPLSVVGGDRYPGGVWSDSEEEDVWFELEYR